MQMLMGAWLAQTIAAVAGLGIADLLQRRGPLTARALVEEHGVDARPDFLQRALRACASAGVVTEDAEGRFGPTALSEVLTVDSAASVRRFAELIGGRWWPLFGGLPESLRRGAPAPAPAASEGERATQRERFGQAMRSRVDSTRGVLAHWDFAGARTVVDVGGGLGHLATTLLRSHPHLRAIVLDLPEVIALAEREVAAEPPEVRARLSLVAGDMFAEVPAADTYLLKAIVHDWDDERCRRVLANCRARLAAGGRVLCVDNVLPPLGDTGAGGAKLLDMLMMVSLPGKERTAAEWHALFAAAGLRVESVRGIGSAARPGSAESIVVGVPA
jgi:predicted O-methyltransferase YrrM